MVTMKYKTIEEYLERSGKTEKELAQLLGISQPYVNQLKRGERRPTPELAAKIEAVTGIPFRALLFGAKPDAA
jgi:transcriptional regulator with XRE-family HTH domain